MAVSPAAQAVLLRAENELRSLIERSLAGGHYDEVASLARLSEEIAALSSGQFGAGDLLVADVNANGSKLMAARTGAQVSPARGLARRSPRFEKDGDVLIKTAPSRSPGQAVYEHRAPRQVVASLIDAITAQKGMGARFTASEILPIAEKKTRREIPSYQAYVALGWLRREGVVVKHGRNRYSLKLSAAGADNIGKLWKALPSRVD